MRRLSKVVNIVPVIAKADTLTLEERDYFKQRVSRQCLFLISDSAALEFPIAGQEPCAFLESQLTAKREKTSSISMCFFWLTLSLRRET